MTKQDGFSIKIFFIIFLFKEIVVFESFEVENGLLG
jgi:hypothetical protein